MGIEIKFTSGKTMHINMKEPEITKNNKSITFESEDKKLTFDIDSVSFLSVNGVEYIDNHKQSFGTLWK